MGNIEYLYEKFFKIDFRDTYYRILDGYILKRRAIYNCFLNNNKSYIACSILKITGNISNTWPSIWFGYFLLRTVHINTLVFYQFQFLTIFIHACAVK